MVCVAAGCGVGLPATGVLTAREPVAVTTVLTVLEAFWAAGAFLPEPPPQLLGL
jgi:hypothetical protein